jgi:hypothetical protein
MRKLCWTLATGVAVLGSYAYVAGGLSGLQVINVRDPANPRRVGRLRPSRWPGCRRAAG